MIYNYISIDKKSLPELLLKEALLPILLVLISLV